jgi:hypothetical protein
MKRATILLYNMNNTIATKKECKKTNAGRPNRGMLDYCRRRENEGSYGYP